MNKEKQEAALRMLSRGKAKPEPFEKPMIVIDGQEFTFAKPADHSCYSCRYYIEEQGDHPNDILTRYCAVTNSHNLRTWPFTHTVCEKWEHERAPQVEEEDG
jgi:hypothetical protein